MTPQLTTVYVPVSIEKDGLPTKTDWYRCTLENDLTHDFFYSEKQGKFIGEIHTKITHWLKPLTGYFLTPEEMEEVKELLSYFVNVDAVIHFKSAQAQHEYNAKLREAKSILNLLNKQP